MGQLVYLKDVVTLRLDEEKCIGCGMCLSVCPHAVLRITHDRVEISDRDACMECGACSKNCPVKAFSVRPGVGCATAVINSLLGRKNASCCCTVDPKESTDNPADCPSGSNQPNCC